MTRGRYYSFRYRAKNIYGWSSAWSPVSYILAADSPTPPSSPVLVTASDSSMTLQLQPCSDDGGSPIIGYNLLMNNGVDGSSFAAVTGYVPTSFTMSFTIDTTNNPTLTSGLIYQIKFNCYNIMGTSDDSMILYTSPIDKPL